MVFSSLVFLLFFLPVSVIGYAVLPAKFKNLWLLIVSLVFYAWGEPVFVLLMLFSTFYMWGLGLLIAKFNKGGKKAAALATLVVSIVLSLALLGFFKYSGFIVSNINYIFGISLAAPKVALPIGISFYTFQALSYVIDVYRQNTKAQKNYINFAMYISLFPQLIAGPIVKYTDIENQMTGRTFDFNGIFEGLKRFTAGLGKKVIFANSLGAVYNTVSATSNKGMLLAWLGAICFTLQIYFDFSGYSDMAIGLGRMFGFEFPENFNYPYTSKSITDFWRRWHITLSVWFKEYVYIPLGGNRKGTKRQIFNLFLVWMLTGLWHGAAWQFVIWGLYYFVILVLEKFVFGKFLEKLPSVIRRIYALLLIILGWVVFAADSFKTAASFYAAMFGFCGLAGTNAAFLWLSFLPIIIIAAVFSTPVPKQLGNKVLAKFSAVTREAVMGVGCLLLLFLCVVFLVGDTYNPFLYFRF